MSNINIGFVGLGISKHIANYLLKIQQFYIVKRNSKNSRDFIKK